MTGRNERIRAVGVLGLDLVRRRPAEAMVTAMVCVVGVQLALVTVQRRDLPSVTGGEAVGTPTLEVLGTSTPSGIVLTTTTEPWAPSTIVAQVTLPPGSSTSASDEGEESADEASANALPDVADAVPGTSVSPTAAPATAAPTTAVPSTAVPSTPPSTTAATSATVPPAPTTAAPTTTAPTTAAPTTAAPTTAAPTTRRPTTAPPTTAAPTTAAPTTAAPTTIATTTTTEADWRDEWRERRDRRRERWAEAAERWQDFWDEQLQEWVDGDDR